jgi:heme exporter protein A
VQSLACVRGGHRVFRGLSFRVGAGQTLVLRGPNGAGKTSTLRILAGLLPQMEGTVTAHLHDRVTADAAERTGLSGWIGHLDGVKAALSVGENTNFFTAFFGAGKAASHVLERVGLDACRAWPVALLSAGQRKRLALARLLLCNRPLWLLDEPGAALDAEGRALLDSLIHEHCGRGGIAIVASHDAFPYAAHTVTLGRSP